MAAAGEPPSKRARGGLQPEDLAVGLAVIYGGDKEGIISDAFIPLNQFWVRARSTGEVVRRGDGEIVNFGAEELRLAAAPQAQSSARVLLIGTELQMTQILEHFGPVDISRRREPQCLVAIPCERARCGPSCTRFDAASLQTCDAASCPMLQSFQLGVEPGVHELARALRPDREGEIEVRPYDFKQALEQMGPDLSKLDSFYCLSSVTVPWGTRDIESASSAAERHDRSEVRCQIDMGATAQGKSLDGEASLEITARRVLGEICGVSICDKVWHDEVQLRLRKALGVDMPVRYWDGPGTKGFVVILPSDLTASVQGGLLTFAEPSSRRSDQTARGELVGGRTAVEWQQEQDRLFPGLPKLPKDWIRVKSRSGEEVYYYNTRTQHSTFDVPLPPGWTKQTSKTTGKTYYFNARLRQSSYELPTE